MSSSRPAGAIGSVTFKEFSHLWEFFFYVIAQAHDYRLGHGKASMAAPLVLYVIPLRVLTTAVLLCKYKYLRNRTLHVIASLAKQSKNPDSRMSQDFFRLCCLLLALPYTRDVLFVCGKMGCWQFCCALWLWSLWIAFGAIKRFTRVDFLRSF